MLTPKFFPAWLPVLVLSLFACQKNSDTTDVLTPKNQALSLADQANAPASGAANECREPDCADAIESVRLTYQQLADDLCDTVWMDITCCTGGDLIYAMVFVAPRSPKCREETLEPAGE